LNGSNTYYTAGNVGVGTNSPGTLLDVNGSSVPIASPVGLLAVSSISTYGIDKGGTVALGGTDGSGSLKTFGMIAGFKENATSSNESGYLAFGTRANGSLPAERMRITSAGNVGIGTTSPDTELDVVSTSTSIPRGIISEQFSADINGAWFMGRKGRGTPTSPAAIASGDWIAALQSSAYDGSSWVVPGFAGFQANGTVATGSVPADFTVWTGTSGFGTEKFRIRSNGNVGIGTASPSEKLHLENSSDLAMLIKSTGGSPWLNFVSPSGNQALITGNRAMHILTNGGDILFATGTGGALTNSTNDRLHITSTGNVGVGVTSPTKTLQVAGEIAPGTDNTYSLGDASFRYTAVYAVNGTIQTSDARQKKDIEDSDLGLDFIKTLRPVSYRWNSGSDSGLHYGLIAQETEQAIVRSHLRDYGQQSPIVEYDKESDRYGLRYTELISPLIKALQELSSMLTDIQAGQKAQDREIASVKTRTQQLETENAKLREENAEIKARLEKLEKFLIAPASH
jgi:cell division protein FtsB